MIENYSKENTDLRKELESYRRQGLNVDKSSIETISMLETLSKAAGGVKN